MLKASKREEERRAWCKESPNFYTLYVKDYLSKEQLEMQNRGRISVVGGE